MYDGEALARAVCVSNLNQVTHTSVAFTLSLGGVYIQLFIFFTGALYILYHMVRL